jgi:hypothetical protein
MVEYHTVKWEIDTPQDESAALQWAIKNFRKNEHNLKDTDIERKKLTYYKRLLSAAKITVIQHGGEQSIVVPDSPETQHRLDPDELITLIKGARENGDQRDYLLALAAAALDNGQNLPGPLKEFVTEFLRSPRATGSRRGRPASYTRDDVISWAVSEISIRWKFFPTRNDATEEASAISIVKKALGEVGVHLTEAAITKIWNKSGSWKGLL